ncbi:hypothetical protein I6J39_16720 [Streptomyces californicus]|uniref:Uncharacterized protein n=1 Tax=Streptomyces californicus TaxID=67351 RepID=A0ABX7J259_9ACTN|nr:MULTISPECIES: hypothetical protein [Streptomyces]QRV28770.1 hypothetical protein I6J39_16720 [Streptomyces californicus]QRV42184.1 hypothetical protein I6J41_16635 [Streptomyces californicus]
MSAYSRAYRGLVKGGMPATEAANLLAQLRAETGAELSAALLAHATELYGKPQPGESRALGRTRTRRFGAMHEAAKWLIADTATGRLTTTPQQRDPRSTT